MTTQAQDTHPQDPIERFALHVEGLRRMPVPRGLARIVHWLLVAFFAYILKVAADIVEQRRNGTLPEVAPADLRPRESGWVEQRSAEVALGGRTTHAPIAQPEINEPAVEQPAALPPPRQDRVQKSKISSGPAPARPRHVDDECSQRWGGWPRWRGPGMVGTAEVGALGVCSKKWALAGGDSCVYFVTI
jgi:hypothetical protein